jgi:quercetin dioxygenase-like cupin family protein
VGGSRRPLSCIREEVTIKRKKRAATFPETRGHLSRRSFVVVKKPWGSELVWARTPKYVGKVLRIKRGGRLSLQYHRWKDETIHMLSGTMDFEVEERGRLVTRRLRRGEGYRIRPRTRHRMTAASDCEVLEVSTPHLLDVVRLEDLYGREGTRRP